MASGHQHQHARLPGTSDRGIRTRLLIAFLLTAAVVLAQAVGSVITGSLALLTDTAHALADASGLLVAVIAATMLLRPPSSSRTWGFARIEVIAALGQAALLLGVSVYAGVEGVRRLMRPTPVPSSDLLAFGIIGLVTNIAAIAVLTSAREANFNMRAAFLEVLNDALGSVGVIIAAIVVSTTGFQQADTIAALFIAALIIPRAVILLRQTVRVLMEFTPPSLDLDMVRGHILELENVKEVHDLHASMIGTGLPVLSAHVVVEDECFQSGQVPQILGRIRTCLQEHFALRLDHATIQLETAAMREEEPSLPCHT